MVDTSQVRKPQVPNKAIRFALKTKQTQTPSFLSWHEKHSSSTKIRKKKTVPIQPTTLLDASYASESWRPNQNRGKCGTPLAPKIHKSNDSERSSHKSILRSQRRVLVCQDHTLEDSELLELLMFDEASSSDLSELSERLISEFGDIAAVVFASEHRLQKLEGVTKRVALRLRVVQSLAIRLAQKKVIKKEVLSCWNDLISYCRTRMAHREKEQLRVFFLDRKNYIIAEEEQSQGTVSHLPVYPREIVKRALELEASAIILVHNHPSGDVTPSNEDLQMTKKICRACEHIDIRVFDHVIVGKSTELSFKAQGLL